MKVFVNAYLEGNLGDDLFFDTLLNKYPNHKYKTISDEEKKRDNLEVYNNRFLNKFIRKLSLKRFLSYDCDMAISIGGSMYMENKGDIHKNFSLGKIPYYILGSNFGPYKTEEYYQNVYNFFKGAQDVCFREKYSYEKFKNLPNVRWEPDILFSLPTDNIKITNRKRVIFSIISCDRKLGEQYKENYQKTIKDLTNYFLQEKYEVCYMSFCKKEGDEDAIREILEQQPEIKEKIEVYYYRGNREEALNVLADSQIIIGSRFHANVLGMVLQKTVIPMIYSDKTTHVLEDIDFKGKTFDIRNLNKEDNSLKKEDLQYIHDISKQREEAKKQFEKLDKVLKEK